jgi:protocatechuate 3,4-dioxygenase beta subunit
VTDGVSQQPLVRARVVLSADVAALPVNRVLLTDADGRYRFTQLPAADTFVVTVSKTGYATQSLGAAPPTYAPVPVRLAPGEVRDAVDVRLTPEVWIAGRLLDTDGTPLANGVVEMSRAVFDAGTRTLVPVSDAMTNDRGEFRVTGLPPGQYYLSARDPAFFAVGDNSGRLEYPETFFPGVLSPDEATRITLEAGGTPPPVTLTLRIGTPTRAPVTTPSVASAAPVVSVPTTSAITGQITSLENGGPIARARVRLSSVDGALSGARVALTDAAGRFRFDHLPAATSYVVTATKTGFSPRAFGEAPPAKAPDLIAVAAGAVHEGANIVLVPDVVVSGRVFDEDDTAFSGALVEAMRPVFTSGRRTLVTVAEAITDDTGSFRLSGLPPGQYYLSAFDPTYANIGDADGPLFYSPTFYPGAVFPDDAVRLSVEPYRPLEDVSFKLVIIKPTRVTGSMVTRPDAGGVPKPLMSAAVTMSPKRNDQFSLFTLTEPRMESNGGFIFANVPPGRYRIQAQGETEREGVTLFSMYTMEVRGTARSTERMSLTRGAVISGTVEWETSTGRTPATRDGLRVRAPMADGHPFGDSLTGAVKSDETWSIRGVMNGDHYIRIEGLPPEWRLKRVEYNGRDITDIPYTFEYEEVKTGFRLVLSDRTTRLFGFLSSPGRDDLQSYAVVVFPVNATHWRPASRYTRIVYPDARGYYELRGLPPGQYHIVATRDVDESDLGDPTVFDALTRLSNVETFTLNEGPGWRVNLTPAVRPRRIP